MDGPVRRQRDVVRLEVAQLHREVVERLVVGLTVGEELLDVGGEHVGDAVAAPRLSEPAHALVDVVLGHPLRESVDVDEDTGRPHAEAVRGVLDEVLDVVERREAVLHHGELVGCGEAPADRPGASTPCAQRSDVDPLARTKISIR